MMLICTLAVLLAQPVTASAASYTPYEEYIPQEYVSLYKDIVGKIGPLENYVFFRAGAGEYMLVAGDLVFEGGAFEAESCTVYGLLVTDSGVSYYQRQEDNFTLTSYDALLYSNLGHYPDLVDRTSFYAFAIVVLLLICLFMYLFRACFRLNISVRRY